MEKEMKSFSYQEILGNSIVNGVQNEGFSHGTNLAYSKIKPAIVKKITRSTIITTNTNKQSKHKTLECYTFISGISMNKTPIFLSLFVLSISIAFGILRRQLFEGV